jgi:mono/diheme cytochrome c family protein
MRKFALFGGVCVLAFAATVVAQEAASAAPKKKDASAAQAKRGEYLVEKIGMCGDCHTPFNEKGQPVKEKHLQGAQLMFKPTVPVPGWVERSADIAGLKGWSDAEAIKFLTTGVDPNGKMAGPPMPSFRFNKADAAAIVAYLRTLAPTGKAAASK